MKNRLYFYIALVIVISAGLILVSQSYLHNNHEMIPLKEMMDETRSPARTASQAVEVGNKICPVSGNAAGEMGEIIKYEYNGKIYNLCCKMCLKDFEKDPEKFARIAETE